MVIAQVALLIYSMQLDGIDFYTISLNGSFPGTIVSRFRTVGTPVMASVSPICGHISGGTRLTVTGAFLDASAKVTVQVGKNMPFPFYPTKVRFCIAEGKDGIDSNACEMTIFVQNDLVAGNLERAIRIIGTDTEQNTLIGRAEIHHNGQWGTICDEGTFDDREAVLLCRTAGYSGGTYLGRCSGSSCASNSTSIWLSTVSC
jgi:hypothetical protein